MLRPRRLSQVSILVAKDQLSCFLAFAGRRKLFHLVDVPEAQLPDGSKRFQVAELLAHASAVRNRIQSVKTTLDINGPISGKRSFETNDLETLLKSIDEITLTLEKSARELESTRSKIEAGKEEASELSRLVTSLQTIGVSLRAISGGGLLATLAGEISRESTSALQNQLDKLTYGNVILAITGSFGDTDRFVAIFPRVFLDQARVAANSLAATVRDVWPEIPDDTKQAKSLIKGRLRELDHLSDKLVRDRDALREESGERIKELEYLAETAYVRLEALAGASATESTYMFQAWVPKEMVAQVSSEAAQSCGGLVSFIEQKESEKIDPASHHQDTPKELAPSLAHSTPTLVRIPFWTRPMQSVVDNFGVPAYHETNPMLFMLITFPVMYGLMFGDFGEGPLMLALGLFLWKLKKEGKKISDIFQPFVNGAELIVMLGIGVTIFGFIFGDFFGFETEKWFGFAPIFSPTKGAINGDIANLQTYMIFILLFGVAHINFGLGLNVYNKLRNKNYQEAFFGPICWAWFYDVGVYLIAQVALSGFKFSIFLQNPVYLPLVLVPLFLLGWKEGPLHAMEVLIQSISNTFSYLRIWALNIADFYIKFAIFYALGGPAITAFSLVGAALGNLLVMILEGLIVFVQTLRLHWVEWFGKFYEGTGFPFSPYQEPMGWTVPMNA